ncbi:Cytochrome c [Hyphomicrobium facile]|uniref:Cytochrome c n=2 Tax=Hyphomicrobium facile TaxID=51670 RepID=A0A1I7N602_9HYPH|nr:Cytochrome c [Hyphomicrobium facile]
MPMSDQTISRRVRPIKHYAPVAARLLAIAAAACAVTSLANAQSNEQEPVQEPGAIQAIQAKKPDPENGRAVARALCTNCHMIGDQPNSAVNADVPSFVAIANIHDQSAERISNWLLNAHGPMPNVHLTRKELGDVAAYIMSLRQPKP